VKRHTFADMGVYIDCLFSCCCVDISSPPTFFESEVRNLSSLGGHLSYFRLRNFVYPIVLTGIPAEFEEL